MTLDQLEVIDIIVKTGSFSAAAKELNRAQPALSYTVKNLEEMWGIKLFDRKSYRAHLTSEGEVILSKIRALLRSAESVDSYAKQLASVTEPIIKMSVNNLFPLEMLADILLEFKNSFKNTQLQISTDHVDTPVNKLLNGDVDLALSMPNPKFGDLRTKKFYEITLVACAAKDYFNHKTVTKAELLNFTQIIVGSQLNTDDNAGIVPGADQWIVADFATKYAFLKKGLGFGYMPMHLIKGDTGLKEISCMKKVKVPMSLQCRESDPMGPAKKYFWDKVLSAR